jgi:hypothetical protein
MAQKSSLSTQTKDKRSQPKKNVAKRGTSEPDDPSPDPGDRSQRHQSHEEGKVDDIRRQLSRGG